MEIIKYYGSDTEKKEFIDHSESSWDTPIYI